MTEQLDHPAAVDCDLLSSCGQQASAFVIVIRGEVVGDKRSTRSSLLFTCSELRSRRDRKLDALKKTEPEKKGCERNCRLTPTDEWTAGGDKKRKGFSETITSAAEQTCTDIKVRLFLVSHSKWRSFCSFADAPLCFQPPGHNGGAGLVSVPPSHRAHNGVIGGRVFGTRLNPPAPISSGLQQPSCHPPPPGLLTSAKDQTRVACAPVQDFFND
ncbi:unnamed protein product [Pleuronectes platessa]|uniref:Uncharacterized protein n=1 Tax=Pleuronectes platessa TaxID=8262 RepID=A0A9N7ZG68_PLEPL|nr:unnamed protein product [Pleuronectes platessa]